MTPSEFARDYKIAPIGSTVRCSVLPAGAQIVNLRSGRLLRTCDFADVTSGRFSEVGLIYAGVKTDMVSRRLKLIGAGETFALSQNGGTLQPRTSLNARPYYEACVATLNALAAVNPDLKIDIGMSPRLRWIFFLVGLLPLVLGALILLGVAISLGSSDVDELMMMGVFGLAFFVYGLAMVVTSNPWRPGQQMTALELARVIEMRLA